MTDLTKAREIFGDELRDTHEYVGWLFTDEAHLFMAQNNQWEQTLMRNAHSFNSQPFKREWIERPEEPDGSDFVDQADDYSSYDSEGYGQAFKAWQNWKPLFKGEWSIYLGSYNRVDALIDGKKVFSYYESENTTLNQFLTECKEQGIRVLLND